MVLGRHGAAACSNSVRGLWGGGRVSPAYKDEMDVTTINSGGQAVDFGNLTDGRGNIAAGCNNHGGLNDGYQGYGARP